MIMQIPRFAFEKFPGSQPILTTQMKSVGESMALGRTFQESFQKAVRSLECGYSGWGCAQLKEMDWDWEQLKYSLRVPNPDRIHAIYAAMKKGMKVDDIHELSFIDKWFLNQLKELVDVEQFLLSRSLSDLSKDDFYEVKRRGFSDKQIAFASKSTEKEVRLKRLSLGVTPAYKRVDTCAAEFEANTPYMYSSYDFECESAPTQRKKVLILGGGPNRIGQGIEFDYCCCHTSFALQKAGYETIMMNSNPETVSTDYDTSDRLYFEPLTVEDVLNIIDLERPDGIIVQFGGQTPLKLALPIQNYLDEHRPLSASGVGHVRIWAKRRHCKSEADALAIAMDIGYPVVVRPSYVLGGRAMEIVYSDDKLVTYLENAVEVDPERPVLIDRYLSDAIEIDVDALADSEGNVVIGGIMEHIEQAGVHSASGSVFLLEANPRASRTVPFVSKAIGGNPRHVSVKEAVLPFEKFQGCDVLLGPEMRSTGEVMGIDFEFPVAFAKAQIAAGQKLPVSGTDCFNFWTAHVLELEGIPVERVLKMHEGRPHAGDMIANGQIQLMVITSSGDTHDQIDGRQLRRMALAYKVPIITTVAGASASVEAIKSLKCCAIKMIALQDFFDIESEKESTKNVQSASSLL
ncbi:Carbamoyl-phosphate synthase large chain, chloroplastic [Vitis vinifera]|uniref:Carbamoyl-phosphate synthase large chain, chloroplastic n=1 Tax=Vitis vinifera TaxID=29760 RepID=A0A438F9X4_VITVI|nr:Carbamoyl-phosphate synthase large chain, chloroplastic [Vitis vinifera]